MTSSSWIALLRIAIGWHFLYEGWIKLMSPGWTSAGYLKSSSGPLSGFFVWLAGAPRVQFIDDLNMWGMTAIGLGLILGVAVRWAAFGGVAMLAMFYLAYPPGFDPLTKGVAEGNYLLVNKNLIELLALGLIASSPEARLGLLDVLKRRMAPAPAAAEPETKPGRVVPSYLMPMSRRQLAVSAAGLPVLGGFVLAMLKKHGWHSFEEVSLTRAHGSNNVVANPTLKSFQFTSLRDLHGTMPQGRIGGLNLSRMILGGNLIGGWAHARDLIYVSKLVKAYHHRDKVFETFAIAERCGVNTILTNPLLCGTINDYWRNGGRIQFISDCGGKDVLAMIQKSIDAGAAACYVQGAVADKLVEDGNFDLIAKSLELIRKNGLPAGIGAHKLKTVQGAVEKGLRPDFWMKTLHNVNYWSAKPQPECDNIWCDNPADTAAYMRGLKEPWIAFKVLAAGAIHPKEGFRYAFENGADFICVGMYDFQIVDDVNLALDVLNKGLIRQREWRA